MRRIKIGIQYVLLDKVGIHRIRPRQSIGEQMDLKIGGFRAGGFRDIPTVVDGVLRGQLARLKALIETGRPDAGSAKRN